MRSKQPWPYLAAGNATAGAEDDCAPTAADSVSTRVIKSTAFEVDGAAFQWWAVGEAPTLVTVRSRIFGVDTGFTDGDPAELAVELATGLLRNHYTKARVLQALFPRK